VPSLSIIVEWAAVLVALVVVAPGGPPPATAATVPLVIWVSPTGSDTSDGATRSRPVRTLTRAHYLACSRDSSRCPAQGRPVHVRLEPGVYPQPHLTWWYYDPVYPSVFMPADYQPGDDWADVAAAGGRPVLDGRWTTRIGFFFAPQRTSPTGRTNLQFLYLEWRRYIRHPIDLHATSAARPAGNLITGNWFHHVGNYWHPGRPVVGYAGVFLVGADRNTIVNNHFTNIENNPATAGAGQEHGVYLKDARSNVIRGNRFAVIGGDPIRVRNRSSNNLIEGNTFERTGNRGYVGDWYCMPGKTNCSPVEYRSWANVVRGNRYLGPYRSGTTFRTVFCYDIPGGACPSDRIRLAP
jgi:hypothetical protein